MHARLELMQNRAELCHLVRPPVSLSATTSRETRSEWGHHLHGFGGGGMSETGIRPVPQQPEVGTGLTIQAVSQLLDVPAPTIRSWERRYGVPPTSRSQGGHRR